MSKERLEEIQKEVNYAYRRDGSISVKAVTMPIEHYEHLYEQAERVKELELECAGWKEAVRFEDEKLAKQIKRYRDALEFGIEYLKNSDIRQVQLVVTALKSALEGDSDG